MILSQHDELNQAQTMTEAQPEPFVCQDTDLDTLQRTIKNAMGEMPFIRGGGRVSEVASSWYAVSGLSRFVKLGECVTVSIDENSYLGQVVRINHDKVIVKSFQSNLDIRLGMPVWQCGSFALWPDDSWQGRIINGLGQPIDGKGELRNGPEKMNVDALPPNALERRRIVKPVTTGIKAIDLFAPMCEGQRIGVFAGSGVGKSTFLAMLARSGGFDKVVFALVGERGREVREFIEDAIGDKGARTIGVVSTSDESPMMRRMAPKVALTIAEYFRNKGQHVLLIVDSITRFAHASRDVLLASGEVPVSRGYPPGVFSEMPKLLERAGTSNNETGAITAIFSVLVDGDDHNDPVADNIRGTLDGHIVLDRAIAEQGRYPAVNILSSVSRLARQAWTPEQEKLILMLRSFIARYEDTRDLRLIGGYKQGVDVELDQAVAWVPGIYETLQQSLETPTCDDAFTELSKSLTAHADPSTES